MSRPAPPLPAEFRSAFPIATRPALSISRIILFNGLIEDWYTQELGYDYAELIMGSRYGLPFVHIECDFKVPSRIGEVIDLTLLVERIGRSSLGIVIVCHHDGIERLRARMTTAMMSLETRKAVPLPQALRERVESYQKRTT